MVVPMTGLGAMRRPSEQCCPSMAPLLRICQRWWRGASAADDDVNGHDGNGGGGGGDGVGRRHDDMAPSSSGSSLICRRGSGGGSCMDCRMAQSPVVGGNGTIRG